MVFFICLKKKVCESEKIANIKWSSLKVEVNLVSFFFFFANLPRWRGKWSLDMSCKVVMDSENGEFMKFLTLDCYEKDKCSRNYFYRGNLEVLVFNENFWWFRPRENEAAPFFTDTLPLLWWHHHTNCQLLCLFSLNVRLFKFNKILQVMFKWLTNNHYLVFTSFP